MWQKSLVFVGFFTLCRPRGAKRSPIRTKTATAGSRTSHPIPSAVYRADKPPRAGPKAQLRRQPTPPNATAQRHSRGPHGDRGPSGSGSPKLTVMTDPEPSVPELRASDDERERAADLLREAMTSGRLGVDELDERMQLVFGAKTRVELERLVDDVLVPADDRHPIAAGAGTVIPSTPRLPVRQGDDGTRRIVSVLSGSDRKGRWRLAAACSVVNVLGGSHIDLGDVELAADRVELKVLTVLGGAEIIVPPGLNVEISEVAFLGGNEIDVGDERPDPGGPVVHVRLVSVLGGAKLSRKQRTALTGSQRELGPAD